MRYGPRHTPTLVNLAVACSDGGQNDRAIELLKEAVALNPRRAAVHVNLGAVYGRIGQYENAIPYYQKAIQLNTNHANAHLLLGLSYRALKRGDQARIHFEKTLELEPDHPQAGADQTMAGVNSRVTFRPDSLPRAQVPAKSPMHIGVMSVIDGRSDALQI